MKENKLTYIANLRLPTERAHSIQIMKMCEAFVSQGIEVELVIPDKRNNLGESEVFGYYGIKNIFKIKRISSTDLLGKTRFFGKLFYWIDFVTFFISLVFMTKPHDGTIIYTRDPILLLPFSRGNYKLASEIHSLPKKNPLFIRTLKRAHVVVAITNFLKKFIAEKGIDDNGIIVVPDAVDLKSFDIEVSKKDLRKELNLPSDITLIGYVGALKTMSMEKGIDTALGALKLMKREAILVLIGGHKDDVAIYKQLAKEIQLPEDRIIFAGRVSPTIVPRYLKAFDVLIAPFPLNEHYKYYMSPLKLFEYMASGVPMVVSDLPSLREIVDESFVQFCRPGDAESLTQALKTVLDNSRDAQGKVDKALLEVAKYTWSERARKILTFSHNQHPQYEI